MLNIYLLYDLDFPQLSIYLREMKTYIHIESCIWVSIETLLIIMLQWTEHYIEMQTPKMMVWGGEVSMRWLGALVNGMSALIKESLRELSCLPWENTLKRQQSIKQESGPHQTPNLLVQIFQLQNSEQ